MPLWVDTKISLFWIGLTMKMRSQTAGRLVAMTFAMFCFAFLHADVVSAATYYVATNGSDSNPGTQSQPFQTVQKGLSVLQAGDTLYLRGGTYAATMTTTVKRYQQARRGRAQ